MTFTPALVEEIKRVMLYYPYRIVYFARRGDEWFVSAVATKRIPNKLGREGYEVFIIDNDGRK